MSRFEPPRPLEEQILTLIRAGATQSRVELARALNVAPATASTYVDRLVAEGFLSEFKSGEKHLGRPPVRLVLNPAAGEFVGIDFDATKILAVALNFSHQVVRYSENRIESTDSVADIIGKIAASAKTVLSASGVPLLGVGVGVPGFVDQANGISLFYPLVPGWKNIPLARELQDVLGVPVALEHNIRAMALAELWMGQGAGIDHFICLGIRSGTAAGIVREGRLLRGNDGLAGEIGLLPIRPPDGFKMPGKSLRSGRILAQDIISTRAIIRDVEAGLHQGTSSLLQPFRGSVTLEKIIEADGLRDALVRKVMDRALRVLADLAQQLVLHHNPRRIILTGPLTGLGSRLTETLRDKLNELEAYPSDKLPEIVNSQLGVFVGAMGASALAMQLWKPPVVS